MHRYFQEDIFPSWAMIAIVIGVLFVFCILVGLVIYLTCAKSCKKGKGCNNCWKSCQGWKGWKCYKSCHAFKCCKGFKKMKCCKGKHERRDAQVNNMPAWKNWVNSERKKRHTNSSGSGKPHSRANATGMIRKRIVFPSPTTKKSLP